MNWELPVVALRNLVILPGVTMQVDVGRPKSKRSVDEAQASDRRVLLITQRESRTDDPTLTELYEVGVLAVLKQLVRLPDNTYQVLVEAQERVKILEQVPGATLRVRVETLSDVQPSGEVAEREAQVFMQEAKNGFEEYQRQNKGLRLDNYQLDALKGLTDGGKLADQIAHHATWTNEEKQEVLETLSVRTRLETVVKLLGRDLERFNMDKKIAGRVKEQMDSNQREYYLREQMKAIGKELGGGEEGPAEVEALREKIEAAGMPAEVKEKALKELLRLERTPGGSPEGTVVRNYIDWLVDVPWSKRDEEVLDIVRTRGILDDDHYGLDDVKERILEFLAVRQLTHKPDELDENGAPKQRSAEERIEDAELRAPILCLVGPPGVGKTSLGKSIARSLNRKFVRMALGGVRDEAEIRGHRRTYIGSMPGRIIQGMKNAGVVNPIVLLDEVDKMSSDWRGDPSSAMLEVLDPEQNHTFQDHYLEVPYDLSQVMFITTANSLQTIPRPLLDRMEVITIPGYTQLEKLEIAKRYRLPRQLRGHGLQERLAVTDGAPGRIIQGMKNAGVVNPIVLLDEVDKMSSDWRGDPSSAMLEVLDPEQNHTFQDHYLEVPYDLSQVMFITTANSLQTIPRPLLDRMEVITIPGYTQLEKLEIAKRYRLPRQLRGHGLQERLAVTDGALRRIIEEYTQESGVRNLDRQISKLARKAARELLEHPWEGVKTVDEGDVQSYLGVPLHRPDRMEKDAQVGVAQGLAWTSVGGTMLVVEALATPGSGKINMTGSLGDVMKESVSAAVAYLRAHAETYGADPEFYKKLDLHVHFPDGATPKDGPSAGITIATAVASAITGRPARMDVAMTGEISLRGRVLPIGGLKEKLLAAHQGGIREVIVPRDNEPNLQDLPESIRSDLKIHIAEQVGEVLDLLLLEKPVASQTTPPPTGLSKTNQPGA